MVSNADSIRSMLNLVRHKHQKSNSSETAELRGLRPMELPGERNVLDTKERSPARQDHALEALPVNHAATCSGKRATLCGRGIMPRGATTSRCLGRRAATTMSLPAVTRTPAK